ncbi:MAG: EamA family transporter [Shinella sp.]|nr:EamA family transporter [Shinella sp.]
MSSQIQNRLTAADTGLLVLVAFVWGFNFVVIALGLHDFPPLLFTALRFAVCSLLVFFVPRPKMSWLQLIAVGVALGTLVFAFLFAGIHAGMPAGIASVIMQMQVFFTVMLSVIALGERPRLASWLAVIVGGTGVALLASERMILGGWPAFSMVLAGALSWGVANILLKTLPKANMLHLMIWMSLVPPLPLLALSSAIEGWSAIESALSKGSWSGIGAVLYTGLLSTVLAYAIWGSMLQRYQASTVAPFALLTPVFGLLSAQVVLHEHHSKLQGVASMLIVGALAINLWGSTLQIRIQALASRLRCRALRD